MKRGYINMFLNKIGSMTDFFMEFTMFVAAGGMASLIVILIYKLITGDFNCSV